MKKIYVLFLLLWICVKPAYAKTYYSEYGEYTNYSEEKISASDILRVESKNFYHAYTENISYEYLEDSLYEKTGNYSTEYSSWYTNPDLLDANYNSEQCNVYIYKPFKELKYFYLKNISEKIHINAIQVYDTKNDSILMQNSDFNMYNNDTYIFSINQEYSLANIKISIFIDKQNVKDATLTLSMSNDNNPFGTKILVQTVQDNPSIAKLELTVDKFVDVEELFLKFTERSYCDKNIDGKIIANDIIYRNIYTKYEYRVITKNYVDLYMDEASADYELDYNDYKTYYRYKIRDKVVLNDNLTIESKDINLNDFISENTSGDIKITSNLNLNVNGIYDINFILPFKTVSTTVKVDIKENYLNALKSQEQYVDYLLEAAETANYSVDQKNLELKENIINTTEEINKLKEEINNYKLKIKMLEEKKDIKQETEINKQSSNLFLILVCLTVIFIIDKFVEKRIVKK